MSGRLRISLALAVATLASCSPRGPGPTVWLDFGTHFYAGESVPLSYHDRWERRWRVNLTFRNIRTGAEGRREFELAKDSRLSVTLDQTTLPDLASASTGVEPYAVTLEAQTIDSGRAVQPWELWSAPSGPSSEGSSSQFDVVTDVEARLPPQIPIPVLVGGPPCCAIPWQPTEDIAPMEDAALAAATEWGGRELEVTSRLATAADLAAARTPGVGRMNLEIHRFEVMGRFPKVVIWSGVAGNDKAFIAVPKGLRLLVPRIRRPMPIDLAPILDLSQ